MAIRRPGRSANPCGIAHLVTWPVIGFHMIITGYGLLVAGPTRVHPFANQVELAARTSGPGLHLAGVGLAPLPDGGAAMSAAFRF